MSGKFRPLDVNFFNTLKKNYHDKQTSFELADLGARINKAMFAGWFQEAWAKTVNERQVQSGWTRSGIHPLNADIMMGRTAILPIEERTPEPANEQGLPETPHTLRQAQLNDRVLRRAPEMLQTVKDKLAKGYETALTEIELLKKELDVTREGVATQQKATGSRKRARYPHGELFDPTYQKKNERQLAERKATEEEARRKRLHAAENIASGSSSNPRV